MHPCRKRQLAVNVMIELARNEQIGPLTLSAIAERHRLTHSYLEHLLARLRAAGLVESTRGPGGGYALGRPAHAISVADIVAALAAGASGTREDDGRRGMANELSQQVDAVMQAHMAGIALTDLLAGHRETGLCARTPGQCRSPAPARQPARRGFSGFADPAEQRGDTGELAAWFTVESAVRS